MMFFNNCCWRSACQARLQPVKLCSSSTEQLYSGAERLNTIDKKLLFFLSYSPVFVFVVKNDDCVWIFLFLFNYFSSETFEQEKNEDFFLFSFPIPEV